MEVFHQLPPPSPQKPKQQPPQTKQKLPQNPQSTVMFASLTNNLQQEYIFVEFLYYSKMKFIGLV